MTDLRLMTLQRPMILRWSMIDQYLHHQYSLFAITVTFGVTDLLLAILRSAIMTRLICTMSCRIEVNRFIVNHWFAVKLLKGEIA